jgi:UDP-glucose 4-epimerase
MSRWLITGGCGFIGRNLVHELVEDDAGPIRVFDNLSIGRRDDLRDVVDMRETSSFDVESMASLEPDVVELVPGDIRDETALYRAAKGADVVVHLAAQAGVPTSVDDPRYDCNTNVLGTFNALEAARGHDVERFVFASSAAPLGEIDPPVHEEMAPRPKAPYGASKLAGEGYCSSYHGSYGLETVALRFGNVYGPRSSHKSSVVAKFIRRAIQGETLEIYGDGQQTRDYIYVGDLVEAIRRGAEADDVGGELFQIATNSETTVNELVEALLPVLEEFGIEEVDVTHTDPRVGDIRRNYSDTSKAEDMLGWTASTSLEDGLRTTIDELVATFEEAE